ncbi:MAG: peptidylprolyl isomerase [Pirellulaceae bacterium]|nr:peptidylprolyl isomerase [Pirellulaceae bacterium]
MSTVAWFVLCCTGLYQARAQGPINSQPPAVAPGPGVSSVSMIPFDSNQVAGYSAVDLPPPAQQVSLQADALASPQLPTIETAGLSRPSLSSQPRLPTAGQLAPQFGQLPSGSNSFADQGLPPLPSFPSMAQPQSPSVTSQPTAGTLASFSSSTDFNRRPQPAAIHTDFTAGRVVAVVGTERVLAGDLAAVIEPVIQENKDRLTSAAQEEMARSTLLRQALPQHVEMKAMQQEFFRDLAGNASPSELRKTKEQVTTRATRMFYDRFVPLDLFKRHKVEDLASLEAKLQESGLSLGIIKNHFLMQVLASQIEEKYVGQDFEIPPQEILAYYRENMEKWQIPARAKWRQITIRFDRMPSRETAQERIRQLFDEVYLGGKPFEAVAKQSSMGYTATEGGWYDWTSQGSLKSATLDSAVFSLPLRRLSNILEDEIGLHFIEVLEREAARTQDMAEIQSEIRKTLSKVRRQEEVRKLRDRITARVPVWTLWPEDIPGSRPLEEVLGP